MASQGDIGVHGGPRRVSKPARILSLVGVLATTALLLLIYVIPVYATAGAALSETGVATQSTGGATLFASNPQAFTELIAITSLAMATLLLTLVTAWSDWVPARWALMALLIPLTGVAVLGVFSIGVFMAPLVTIGWFVFAMRSDRSRAIDAQ